MTAILGWLMTKVGAIVIAALCLIFFAVTVVQTVQLYGLGITLPIIGPISFAEGAIPARVAAEAARDVAIHNQGVLQSGLDRCNVSADQWAAKGKEATQRAAAAIAKAKTAEAALADARRRLAAVPPSNAVCPSVEAIFKGAFGQ